MNAQLSPGTYNILINMVKFVFICIGTYVNIAGYCGHESIYANARPLYTIGWLRLYSV